MASWPVLRWFIARLSDGGDERFGLVALALALVLTPRAVWREGVVAWRVCAAGALVLTAALGGAFFAMPMLVRALLAVGALAVLLHSETTRGGALGRASLMALSLPLVATLQFFAGYPLRVMTAELGRPLIALCGVATERAGVALTWSGGQVVVDAPCSGVHMLWTGGVLVCALAAWLRLSAWQTLALGTLGLAGILISNVVRAAVLFFIESGLWDAPRWAHEGVGLVIFAALAAGVLWLGLRLKRDEKIASPFPPVTGFKKQRSFGIHALVAFGVMCVVAAILPLSGAKSKTSAPNLKFTGWPEMFDGKPMIRLTRPGNAAAFAAGFAGETAVFKQGNKNGGRIVVLRWIQEASRGLHPAADCFRASGYEVKPSGLVRDAKGVMWAEFFATRGNGESWRVRERWHDEHGDEWTDVSAWYWSAVRAEDRGPWWAVTIAEQIEG